MEEKPSIYTTNHKIVLLLFGLLGAGIVMMSTSRYGAGLSPDSVHYIATARHISAGDGVISYTGNPVVVWPPLYPAVLAFVDYTTGIDPLSSAHVVNAILFGIIAYLSGLLFFKHLALPAFLLLVLLGPLRFLVYVSRMAWSEPLFICFVLIFLLLLKSYVDRGRISSVLFLALSVALACLTRYIGVVLIPTAIICVLFFRRDAIATKIRHLIGFLAIAILPIGAWILRNYYVSKTLFGPRSPSNWSFSDNLLLAFDNLLIVYVPWAIVLRRSVLLICILLFAALVVIGISKKWVHIKAILLKNSLLLLFIIAYTGFLVATSTTTAYDPISMRLLSPVYVPLTLVILSFAAQALSPLKTRFSPRFVSLFLWSALLLWLVYPVGALAHSTLRFVNNGAGYSGRSWRDSETIAYIRQYRDHLESDCCIYSNAPDAAYILADITAGFSPRLSPGLRRRSSPLLSLEKIHAARQGRELPPNSLSTLPEAAFAADGSIQSLKGSWPEEDSACLIWFDAVRRTYLLTVDELQTIADVHQIMRFEDGAVYSVTRKQ